MSILGNIFQKEAARTFGFDMDKIKKQLPKIPDKQLEEMAEQARRMGMNEKVIKEGMDFIRSLK